MNQNQKQKKKKNAWQKYLAMALMVLTGIFFGILIAMYEDQRGVFEKSFQEEILSIIVTLLIIYVALFVNIIIHEAGHLIFGLLSGYTFTSFRILSFMWIKEDGKMKLRRFSIPGTAGQCLMAPPDLMDGNFPVVLYNLGGSLMNIIAALLFLGLFFVFADIPFLSTTALSFSLLGFISAIMNGIPMQMGSVNNDGYNAFLLVRNPEAMRSFWVQLKVNEQIAKGIRLKDMPDEWFDVPSDEAMQNGMVTVTGVLACNRLMDAQQFEEADTLMEHILNIDSGMVDLHRSLIICDRMYVELITANRKEILDTMLTRKQKKFMKQMKSFLPVLRTEYVYVLLCEKDHGSAEKIRIRFEKCAKTYPYPNEVQSERELIEITENSVQPF